MTSQYTLLQQRPPQLVLKNSAVVMPNEMGQQPQPIFAIQQAQQAPQSPIFIDTKYEHIQHMQQPHHQHQHQRLFSPPAPEIKSEPQPYSPMSDNSCSPTNSTITINHQDYQQGHQPPPPVQAPTPGPLEKRTAREELCLVCGDRASGYHYNALACEGCKGFFRRSITKNNSYACKYGGSCEIDMYMRRKCQACRLKKCYTVGMRSECVVPEDQCIKKRQAKNSKMGINNNSTANNNTVVSSNNNNNNNNGGTTTPSPFHNGGDTMSKRFTHNQWVVKHLKPEEEELINRVVYFQLAFEYPQEEDVKKVYHVPLSTSNGEGENGRNESDSDSLFRHITEMTILTVNLIVEFCKHLPGFLSLEIEDQVILLKGCSSEVMMLRAARRYDPNTDSIIFATNHPFTKENYNQAGLANEALFRFCRRMIRMKVDNAEFGLLTAIAIFSERKNLKQPRRVEKIQEIYVDALRSYVMSHRKRDPMVDYAKLLGALVEIRTLGNSNSRTCFDLKLVNRKLPKFLAEVWDIK